MAAGPPRASARGGQRTHDTDMATSIHREQHVGAVPGDEPELELATDDVLRYVWHGRFGDVLIECRDGQTFVNGQAVEPAQPVIPLKT